MATTKQAGFSLIELILVMAITSSLVVIAFVGQRGLRARAQFDADVDKVVANVAQARNEATAGVNVVGDGVGNPSSGCGGGTGYIFAGLALTADNANPGGVFKVDYYEAGPTSAGGPAPSNACVFDSRTISLPSSLLVSGTGSRVLFVRTKNGGLAVCPVSDLAKDVLPAFEAGACTVGLGSLPYLLTLTDSDGHSSQLNIDSSGLAKRLN
jgi:prepilin-type N-terminal cleavage/methylation domain-containing protein